MFICIPIPVPVDIIGLFIKSITITVKKRKKEYYPWMRNFKTENREKLLKVEYLLQSQIMQNSLHLTQNIQKCLYKIRMYNISVDFYINIGTHVYRI